MFTVDCPDHGAPALIWPSGVDGIRNTDRGIEVFYHCTCGRRGVWLTGRASRARGTSPGPGTDGGRRAGTPVRPIPHSSTTPTNALRHRVRDHSRWIVALILVVFLAVVAVVAGAESQPEATTGGHEPVAEQLKEGARPRHPNLEFSPGL